MRAIAIVVLALAVTATWASAEPPKYLGKHPADPARGVIEQDGVQFEIVPGTEVPGWGQVQAIGDETLIIDRHLSEAEKEDLRAHGAPVYDISRVRVPREDLKVRFR